MSKGKKPPKILAMLPSPTASASEKVKLGLRLRTEASLTGRCACGAVAQLYEVTESGELEPAAEVLVGAGRAYVLQLLHEHDCPATSPELTRAVRRGEIADPGGDFLQALSEESP